MCIPLDIIGWEGNKSISKQGNTIMHGMPQDRSFNRYQANLHILPGTRETISESQ
jgi:hypothetical protein